MKGIILAGGERYEALSANKGDFQADYARV